MISARKYKIFLIHMHIKYLSYYMYFVSHISFAVKKQFCLIIIKRVEFSEPWVTIITSHWEIQKISTVRIIQFLNLLRDCPSGKILWYGWYMYTIIFFPDWIFYSNEMFCIIQKINQNNSVVIPFTFDCYITCMASDR